MDRSNLTLFVLLSGGACKFFLSAVMGLGFQDESLRQSLRSWRL